jgi:hypothetical protein
MIDFQNIVVAGTKLVRDSIQSPNYVVGTTGWSINQDGSVEFSNATIRGTLIAGNGNVVLNSSGLDVFDNTLPYEYLVNRSAGFYARNVPDDGGHTQMYPENVVFYPQNPTPGGRSVTSGGLVNANVTTPSAGVERVNLQLKSPAITTRPQAVILLEGESSAADRAKITLGFGPAIDLHINGYVEDHDLIDIRNHEYFHGENAAFLASFGPVTSVTFPVTFTHAFSAAPCVVTQIASGAGRTSGWDSRPISITSTGFTYFLYQVNGVATTWVNDLCLWTAEEFTP